jgi:VanZ family protein
VELQGKKGMPVKAFVRWLPAVVWMGVIFYLSSRTGESLNSLLPLFHLLFPQMQSFNWGHFFAYFFLSCTYYWGFLPRASGWKIKVLVVLLCGLYGISDEYHQSFVPGRTPDGMDIRNDMIGAALAMLFVSIPAVRKRLEKSPITNKY